MNTIDLHIAYFYYDDILYTQDILNLPASEVEKHIKLALMLSEGYVHPIGTAFKNKIAVAIILPTHSTIEV